MKYIRSLFITLIVGAIVFYFSLPAINIQNMEFWSFIFLLVVVFYVSSMVQISDIKFITQRKKINWKKYYGLIALPLIFLGIIIVNFFCSPVFNAKSYQKRITVDETATFLEDVEEVDFNHLPLWIVQVAKY